MRVIGCLNASIEHRQTAVVYRLAQTEQNWAVCGLGATPFGEGTGDGSSEPPSSRSEVSPLAEPLSHGSGPTFFALDKTAASTGPSICAPQRETCAGDGRAGDGSADDGASSGTITGCGASIADRGVHGGSSSCDCCARTSRTLSCELLGAGGADDAQGASRFRHRLRKDKRAILARPKPKLARGRVVLRAASVTSGAPAPDTTRLLDVQTILEHQQQHTFTIYRSAPVVSRRYFNASRPKFLLSGFGVAAHCPLPNRQQVGQPPVLRPTSDVHAFGVSLYACSQVAPPASRDLLSSTAASRCISLHLAASQCISLHLTASHCISLPPRQLR